MSKLRPDLPHLLAGLALAAFVFVLVLVHRPVPDFLTYAALALFGIAGGATVPRAAAPPAAALAEPAGPPAAPAPGMAAGAPASGLAAL